MVDSFRFMPLGGTIFSAKFEGELRELSNVYREIAQNVQTRRECEIDFSVIKYH